MAFRPVSFGHDASASGAPASVGRPFLCRVFSTPGIARSCTRGFQLPERLNRKKALHVPVSLLSDYEIVPVDDLFKAGVAEFRFELFALQSLNPTDFALGIVRQPSCKSATLQIANFDQVS